jgi:hypothetical protein
MTQRGVGGSIYLMVALQDPQLPGTIAKYRGQDIVCLLYNPRDYDPKAQSSLTASNEDYTRALRQAGAKIHLMPKVVNLP